MWINWQWIQVSYLPWMMHLMFIKVLRYILFLTKLGRIQSLGAWGGYWVWGGGGRFEGWYRLYLPPNFVQAMRNLSMLRYHLTVNSSSGYTIVFVHFTSCIHQSNQIATSITCWMVQVIMRQQKELALYSLDNFSVWKK